MPPLLTTSAAGETYRGVDEADGQLATLKAKRDQMASTYRPAARSSSRLDAPIASLSSAAKTRKARTPAAGQPRSPTWSMKISRPT